MNSDERKKYILTSLDNQQTVKINELSKTMDVTRETVRKDLYHLEDEGLIKKIHGGAIRGKPKETDYNKRKVDRWQEKEKIAKVAVSYIEEGDTIYLDYGTTTLALAKEIAKLQNITVVTNTIPIVNMLLPNKAINIIILGGILRNNESSLFGQFASNNIPDIFVNIGFFGCSGVDSKAGITSHHMGEVLISKQMIAQCKTSLILADSTKFGMVAFNRTAKLEDVDIIVSDCQQENSKTYEDIRQAGVELVFADQLER